jgi:hypothetical protein
MAHQALEAGSLRVAIVDASAAVDLAQSVAGPTIDDGQRRRLDDLRHRAIDIAEDVRESDARRALDLADEMIRAASPT